MNEKHSYRTTKYRWLKVFYKPIITNYLFQQAITNEDIFQSSLILLVEKTLSAVSLLILCNMFPLIIYEALYYNIPVQLINLTIKTLTRIMEARLRANMQSLNSYLNYEIVFLLKKLRNLRCS